MPDDNEDLPPLSVREEVFVNHLLQGTTQAAAARAAGYADGPGIWAKGSQIRAVIRCVSTYARA